MRRSPNEDFNAAHAKHSLLNLDQNTVAWSSSSTVQDHFYMSDEMETAEFSESFHDLQEDGTSTKIVTHPIQFASSKIAGFVPDDVVMSFPEDWREPREASIKLRGLGIKLFDVKSRTMIGREESRSQIWKCLQNVCSEHKQQVMFVEGADGIGKKSFANWLAYRADELGLAQWLSLSLDSNKNSMDIIR